MDRRLSCHGSATVEALVDARQGDEGFEGVMGHWMIADRVIRELGAIPPDGGLPPPDVPRGYKMPKGSLWLVDWAVRHVRETVPDDWSLMVELPLAYKFGRWVASGHQDVTAISPDELHLRGKDWKLGYIPQEPAENNDQVLTYIVLNKIAWPALASVEFEICQPRASEEDGFQRVSSVKLEGDRLDRAAATLDARVCEALDDPMTLNTGPRQCKWCVGPSCPAIQAQQRKMKLTLTPQILATIKRTPDDALLGDFVVTGRMLAKPMEDALEMLHARLDQTESVRAGDGTVITRKVQKGSYTIEQPLEFFQAAKELLVTDERMSKVYKPSMTRLVDEVAEALNVPKNGMAAVTGQGIVDAKFKTFVTQGERRILQLM